MAVDPDLYDAEGPDYEECSACPVLAFQPKTCEICSRDDKTRTVLCSGCVHVCAMPDCQETCCDEHYDRTTHYCADCCAEYEFNGR